MFQPRRTTSSYMLLLTAEEKCTEISRKVEQQTLVRSVVEFMEGGKFEYFREYSPVKWIFRTWFFSTNKFPLCVILI
jgi:hypothetical protein